MTDVIEQFDNMVGHIVGINDERDITPLLLGLKNMWPVVYVEIAQLRSQTARLQDALATCRELRRFDQIEIERMRRR